MTDKLNQNYHKNVRRLDARLGAILKIPKNDSLDSVDFGEFGKFLRAKNLHLKCLNKKQKSVNEIYLINLIKINIAQNV